MNEEIKKIIFDLEGCCGMVDYMLTPIENNLLVSYIKQLQQENQQLKEQLEKKYKKVGTLTNEILYEENTKLLFVLDEIREYINKNECNYIYLDCKLYETEIYKRLLQILDKVKQ